MKYQENRYNDTFPTILRGLLEAHPITGKRTTLKELAAYIGIRQQTISLYQTGETLPTSNTIVKMAEYFNVSIDYLLTGVSSVNKEIHEELGLDEKAIQMIKRAKGMPINEVINDLFSDNTFYTFLEDVDFKSKSIKALTAEVLEKYEGLNVENYFIWDLQKYVEEFIMVQLNKRGLFIENNGVNVQVK